MDALIFQPAFPWPVIGGVALVSFLLAPGRLQKAGQQAERRQRAEPPAREALDQRQRHQEERDKSHPADHRPGEGGLENQARPSVPLTCP
jgi:hypothetical protein